MGYEEGQGQGEAAVPTAQEGTIRYSISECNLFVAFMANYSVATPTQGVGPGDSIPQTGTQINSSKAGTLQHLPSDRLPLRFDPQSSSNILLPSRELPPVPGISV
jgi:hypothetical protein